MEDERIVELYWARDDRAIAETQSKYGAYCRSVAYGILRSREDAEECENDAYIALWNCIPPHRPQLLSAFLARITRNIALKRRRDAGRQKRGGGEAPLPIDELAKCIPDRVRVEENVVTAELTRSVNRFIDELPADERRMFLCRYWYCDSISEIASRFGYSESKVKSALLRMRKKLYEHLEKEELL